MADDLSLLFRLRGDATSLKQATADSRQSVNQLKQAFGPELTQTATKAGAAFTRTFSDIGDSIENLVRGRVPVVGDLLGEALGGVTSGIEKSAKSASEKVDLSVNLVANSLSALSSASGKSVPQLTSFLKTFGQLKTEAQRNEAAFEAFGGSVDLVGNKTAKFLPELKEASAAMNAVSAETAAAASSFTSLLGPVALAIAALTVEIAIVVSLTKEIFELAKASAEYQGKLFDLSQQVGVSVETLSALEVAALQTGGSIDGVVQSLGIFQKKLEESVEDEGSKAAISFRKLGIEATDTEAAFRQAVAALARMPEGFSQTATAMELFGRGGKAVLAVAKESKGDIDAIIDRLRDLGLVTTEQAKLADEFNDQLVLLRVQLRGLGTQAIPVVLDALRDVSELLRENRDLFRFLQAEVKILAQTMRLGLGIAKQQLEGIQTVLALTVAAFQKIKESVEFIVKHPIPIPGFLSPAPPPKEEPKEVEPQRDPFTEQLKKELESRKRLQAVLNVEFAKRQQQAEDAIAIARREFEAGRSTREELLQVILANNRKKAKAEIDSLENQRSINLKELALEKDDLDRRRQLANANLAIDAQVVAKRAELARTAADLTAKSRLDEQRDDLARLQARTETETQLAQERIAQIEREIDEEVTAREEGLAQIEALENALLVRRGQLLKRELELAGIGPERDLVIEKIKAIEVERTTLERQQSERRIALAEAETQRLTAIALSTAESINAAAQIGDEVRIARAKALAALRIQTEEQAERAILRIKLDALAREDELARLRRDAAEQEIKARIKAIQDQRAELTIRRDQSPDLAERVALQRQITALVNAEIELFTSANAERNRLDQELNNQLRVNNAQRAAITEQGNRDINDARQQDLDNEQRYNDELERLRERTRNIEFDAAEEVIRLMRVTFARRRDIIRAERDLDLAREADRNRRALESINRQQRAVGAEIKILEARLESLTIGTTEEIEQYERIIAALERLRLKRLELQGQADAEGALSDAITRGINAGADIQLADPDTKLRDTFDDLGEGITNLTGKFADLIGAGKEFEGMSSQLASAIGGALAGAFDQFANAIGQTVYNWVLLGETGPAVMRKILAQALASLAAQASVEAIKELALGFATLFFNPAESAGHFTAAALWGSIAGVSAVAGRAVAGDLFKPQQSASGAGRSGSGSSTRDREPNPIDLSRQQQTINVNIIVHGEPGPGFNQEVVRAVVHDVSINGPSRDAIVKTAGG